MAKTLYTNITDSVNKLTFTVRAPNLVAAISDYDKHFNMRPAFQPTGDFVLCATTATINEFIEWFYAQMYFEFVHLEDIPIVYDILFQYLAEMDLHGTDDLPAHERHYVEKARLFQAEMYQQMRKLGKLHDMVNPIKKPGLLGLLSRVTTSLSSEKR